MILAGDCMLVRYLNRLKNSNEGETEMKTMETETEKPSYWQLIFLQSKVNGANYSGEELPGRNWDWPKDTYLQRRLHQAKYLQVPENSKLN
jgi:hypothetical protein